MADTIDELQIEINAKATKANDAIDRLVGKLDRLTTSLSRVNGTNLNGLANGVQRLGNAMQVMNTIKTADFTRLAKNLTKLGTVNVSALNSAASSMSHLTRAFNSLGTVSANAQAVGEMAKNIAKLGNKSVQAAITNIPQLATAMNGLMTTLSRSPQVSQNVIQMTNALANLASQGSKVGSASNSIVRGLNRTSASANTARKSFGGLASAIGKFYATYFMVIRGLKGLWSSIESTADYIEAYNYLNVALGKIGSDWSQQFEKYGYDNAESYADSFGTRLSERLRKLSGLQVTLGADGQGLLTESGMKNLGLNIQEITQYASQLASVTNSVGQTGEVSLAVASSFTKLAGDISSLFNVDYSSVSNNLQSGLIGQSRALYKYGIDITNATLQTYAYELGLSKSVSEMTQAEKMQLRMIAILDQSKVSWGDLANTINSPSNMIRQFKNNLKETGIVLGQLFIPILQKVLPVINGVTIAIKRLLVNIANLLGVKIDFDAFGQGYTEIEDGIDGIGDAFDDATASAKKFKTYTLGIDELNIQPEQADSSGSGGGIGGGIDLTDEILQATSEYEKAWQEAFAKMENQAQEFADKIGKFFKQITDPLKDLFKDISIGDWFSAGQDTSKIVVAIFDLFSRAIASVEWKKIGENIGEFLKGIEWTEILKSVGNFGETLINSAVDLWGGSFDANPIATALVTALGVAHFTGLSDVLKSKITSAVPANISLGKTIALAGITFSISFSVSKAITKALAEKYNSEHGEEVFDISVLENFTISDLFSEEVFSKIMNLWKERPSLGLDLISMLFFGYESFDELLGAVTTELEKFSDYIFGGEWLDAIGKSFVEHVFNQEKTFQLWEDTIYLFTDKIKQDFAKGDWGAIGMDILLGIAGGIMAALSLVWSPIEGIFLWIWDSICAVFGIHSPAKEMEPLGEYIFLGIVEGFESMFPEFTKSITNFWNEKVKPWFSKERWHGLLSPIQGVFGNAFKGAVNTAIGFINKMLSAVEKMVNDAITALVSMVDIINVIPGIDLSMDSIKVTIPKIPTYQTGGFPEDGLFMANHNELVGQFSNGKTAVANNEQIVSGIEGGVERAVARVLAPYLADIAQNTRETADKDFAVNIGDRDIARANARGSRSLGYALIT